MTQFTLVNENTADETAKPILTQLKGKFGMLPNFFGVLGMDGVSLDAFLALQAKMGKSKFSKREQELLALAVANYNGCHYCVSAHTFTALKTGLTAEECVLAQQGQAEDPREQTIINLALAIVANKGQVDEMLVSTAKDAGFTDADIIEITLLTAINTFTNWLNNVVNPPIDFPEVDLVQVIKVSINND